MELEQIFSSHMVFAAGKPISVRGKGNGTIQVSFAQYTQTVTAEHGTWTAEFSPMDYGGSYTLRAEGEGQTILLDDIYIGEVYLVAG